MLCPSCRAQNEDGFERCFTCGVPLVVSPADLVPGSVVASRYEILRLLGQGGMGRVFQAHDRVLDEIVALKTLRSDISREPDVTRRFLGEIKLARRARHENVCAIHEYGEDAGLRFIAMEYIEGVDLRRLLRERGRLPPAEAFDVVVQVAQGLQAIHEAGIIHRDLKTPNIMRDSKGVVRLMDFGIAKRSEAEVTLGGQVLGTPEYMSPEQARGQKVSFQTDIYAMGVLTFEVFAGRVPFHGDTPVATILKHLNEAPPLDGAEGAVLPREIIPFLRRALAKAPGDRYGTAQEVVVALQAAQAAYLGHGAAPVRAARALNSEGPGNSSAVTSDPEEIETWPQNTPSSHEPASTTAATETMGTPASSSLEPPRAGPRTRPWPLGLGLAGGAVAIVTVLVAVRGRNPETTSITSPAPVMPSTSLGSGPEASPTPSPPPTAMATPTTLPNPTRSPKPAPVAEPRPAPSLEPPPSVGPTEPTPPEPEPTLTPTPSPAPPEPTLPRPGVEIPRLDQVRPDPRNRGATYARERHPAGNEVAVYLKVVLSEQGVVTDVNAISGAEPFATAAIEAAWAWRFAPPTVGGRPSTGFTILRVVVRPD